MIEQRLTLRSSATVLLEHSLDTYVCRDVMVQLTSAVNQWLKSNIGDRYKLLTGYELDNRVVTVTIVVKLQSLADTILLALQDNMPEASKKLFTEISYSS